MTAKLTLVYNPQGSHNLLGDGQIENFGAQLAEIIRTGYGVKIVDISQEEVLDEIRLRVARDEFEYPVDVYYYPDPTKDNRWVGAINEYGALHDVPWPDADRVSNILKTAIAKRRRKQQEEFKNGN